MKVRKWESEKVGRRESLKASVIFSSAHFLTFSLSLLFIAGCFSSRDLSTHNLSDVYKKGEQLFHPEFTVVHHSDTSSTLFVKINPKEFLFMRGADDRFKAAVNIHYSLVESYESTTPLREGLTTFEILQDDNSVSKIYPIDVSLPKPLPVSEKEKAQSGYKEAFGWKGLMIINIADNQKNYNEDFFVNIDNSSNQSRQAFFVQRKNESYPVFKNYLTENDTVQIFFRDSSVKNFYVRYYHRNFILAPPPFSFDIHDDFDYRPDSTFTYHAGDFVSLEKIGFYHFQTDTTELQGFTLFRFANSFPYVTSPEQMFEAVRYLTTKREFEEMKQNQSKKAAMDKFWFDLGGNAERTKSLIKSYYIRVQEANRFFTSHTEGWRTDRGMIYIVFGKPNNVYKSANAESWIYGTPGNALSLNFFFVRVNNPFTDNDYTLTREPIYEGSYYRAVDVWRQGRAYNDF